MSLSIEVRAAKEGDMGYLASETQLTAAVARRMIAEGDLLIATVDGAPVGLLWLDRFWAKRPFIALIRVLAPYRGRGVGRALLERLVAGLREQGHELLYSSSEAHAAEAQAWHRHMGFEECGFIAGINRGGVGEVFFRIRL
jgi:GNAT superfamily N-acetyltransferase